MKKVTQVYGPNQASSLMRAFKEAGTNGIVLSMPGVIDALSKNADLGFTNATTSEAVIGADTMGRIYRKNTPIVVVMHGTVTPESIKQELRGEQVYNITDILKDGKLPDGRVIELLSCEEACGDAPLSTVPYGIVVPLEAAQGSTWRFEDTESLYCGDGDFSAAIAIAGSLVHLEKLHKYIVQKYDESRSDISVREEYPVDLNDSARRHLHIFSQGGGKYADSDFSFTAKALKPTIDMHATVASPVAKKTLDERV